MLYCNKCRVSVIGSKTCCPLCQESLTGTGTASPDAFPVLEKPKYSKHFLLRLISLIAISAAVIAVGLNYIIPAQSDMKWSLFIVLGIICAWISTAVVVVRRRNILKNINWQLLLLTVFAVFWDYLTGWRGWSIEYVIPFSCMASMACMYILSLALKIKARGFVSYLIFDAIYGVIPVIFILTGRLNVTYPSVFCVICSIISISAILLFKGRYILDEATRKFHV